MKRSLHVLIFVLFTLSACTLTLPTQTQMNVILSEVGYQDAETLAIALRGADQEYFITVNGEEYDCFLLADQPGVVECTGPVFEPGEEVTIRIYEDDTATKPLTTLTFFVPEYDPEKVDSDGDGLSDATDKCPGNPDKGGPGQCGCGIADVDTDGDGTADCIDQCPEDASKTAPGADGCAGADTSDTTGDGDADKDSDKDTDTDSGSEGDSDGDGVADEDDLCPDDPDKKEPGECGCGLPEDDEDEDGIPDCVDECPIAYSDTIGDPCDKDEDDDGINDGGDQCPFDPNKRFAGQCGCGNVDFDTDGDGTADCIDECPEDKNKIEPGKCGCGVKDKDTDKDGQPDCKDPCPTDPNDPVGDPCCHDEDCDGWDDWIDECPYDPTRKHLPCGSPVPCP